MNDLMIPTGDALAVMEKIGEKIAKSGLFGVKSADQAVALMLVAQSEGRNPMEAARDYHIIQGRPALKSDAMLARFQLAGGKVEWKEITDTRVVGVFSHPQGGTATIDWDMKRAERAKLTGKDNWSAYPRQMLRARVISEGVRTVYPAVCVGIYTKEEAEDMAYIPPAPEPEMEVTIKAAEGQETVIESDDEKKARAKRIVEERGISDEVKAQAWKGAHGNWDDFIARLEAANAGPQPEIF